MTMIPFDKMEGAGNDFILIDHRRPLVADADKPRFATAICDRKFGVGADGLVFIENDADPAFAFAWDFYNADGSRAEMCGNASRCATRFAKTHGLANDDHFRFRTLAGPIEATWLPEGARVRLGDIAVPPRRFEKLGLDNVDGAPVFDGWLLNTGVPHFVVAVDDLAAVDVVAWGRGLRRHPAFAPAGTNVNFVARADAAQGGGIAIRTYERGVEDETLACGTGATAAALVAPLLYGLQSPVLVHTRGGMRLEIAWRDRAEGGVENLTLAGPARRAFTGEYAWEA